ncbi:MAG: tRNA lysidine(34) synthetase TilS [Chitinophagales bacterium]
MSLLQRFSGFINNNNLFSAKDKLLLAVSGGVDSVVLCELCKQAGYDFMIAHCNFQLRGEESERDEKFVRELGVKYKVEVKVKKFDTENHAARRKVSVQEAARELRYDWFYNMLYKLYLPPHKNENDEASSVPEWHVYVPESKTFVLTAHHADDNIETVLMNFFRGTGLHGLTGIPLSGSTGSFAVQTFYIRRPLLPFFKDELVAFARDNQLNFVEDSSNQSSKYTRNFFRNEIIPGISKVYPQVKENLQDNIERFKEIEALYKVSVDKIKKKLCKQKGDEIHIPVRQLLGYSNKALIYEIISGHGFSEKQIDEVLKLANADSGSYIDSLRDNYRIIKHRHWFIITPILSGSAENIVIERKNNHVNFPGGFLELNETGARDPIVNNHAACLDATEIQFPLLLRQWKTGDYFYPLGMKKKKKLSRFFIDQKLSRTAKEKIWVIEMNRKIVWIVGHRIDDRFKITDKTTRVLTIKLHA